MFVFSIYLQNQYVVSFRNYIVKYFHADQFSGHLDSFCICDFHIPKQNSQISRTNVPNPNTIPSTLNILVSTFK